MSAKDYVFALKELETWNDTVKDVQKLKKTRSVINNTNANLKITVDNNVDKKTVEYMSNTSINRHDKNQTETLKFDDSSRINSRMLKSINKGNYKIDKTLDLHGHSREQAYNALISFLDNACEQKYRMVLIITGKGNSSPGKHPILKNSLLNWLETYSLNDKFLYINHAHPKHGGDGAVYIVLKKQLVNAEF